MSADPLVIEFEVGVSPQHAFETWTQRCATWWPPSHTVSGDPAAITFEPYSNGRIFEHDRTGDEYDWGRVLEWQPPTRLRYLWHLFFDASEATEVEVTFKPLGAGTAVRLEQRGWDQLGQAAPPRRAKTERAWEALTAVFAQACGAGEASEAGATRSGGH
jgi:uncharacterized protein YndB with AHSA1/START domain